MNIVPKNASQRTHTSRAAAERAAANELSSQLAKLNKPSRAAAESIAVASHLRANATLSQAEPPSAAPLGTVADKVTPPPSQQAESLTSRAFARHDILRRLLRTAKNKSQELIFARRDDEGYTRLPRLADCRVKLNPKAEQAALVRENGRAAWHGLQVCESANCPLCAPIRAELESRLVSRLMSRAFELGYSAQVWTLTLQHRAAELLALIFVALLGAWKAFQMGRSWQEFRAEHELLPIIRRAEIPHGDNGWHAHLHLLVLGKFKEPLTETFDYVDRRWGRMLGKFGKSGLRGVRAHVRAGTSYAAEYIAKWGKEPSADKWGAEDELLKADAKSVKGRDIFQLMDIVRAERAELAERQAAERLLIEFFSTMRRRRMVDGLSRLAAALGVNLDELRANVKAELAAELAAEQAAAVVILPLDALTMNLIKRLELRPELSRAAEQAASESECWAIINAAAAADIAAAWGMSQAERAELAAAEHTELKRLVSAERRAERFRAYMRRAEQAAEPPRNVDHVTQCAPPPPSLSLESAERVNRFVTKWRQISLNAPNYDEFSAELAELSRAERATIVFKPRGT